ncbi:MAG: alpha-N-arabinofuranosidase [Halosimplex sp.]
MTADDLLVHRATADDATADVTIDTDRRADYDVEPLLFAKFCEHLGNNIYHGMDAQILFNPVFGEWHFRGSHVPSGGNGPTHDIDDIRETVEEHGRPLAYPESTDTDALLDAYQRALAFGWLPTEEDVAFSPDTGPSGNRAQRIETESAGAGVEQRTHLPLHRVDDYEFRCKVRAVEPTTARVTVATDGGDQLAAVELDVGEEWATVEGELELPSDVDPDGVYRVSLTADEPAEFVVERLLLYPADHVDYADPEVVEFLRESDLTALRWPGGNFVSGYDWRDGVGPVDERPTNNNPNWEGLEYNLFGTDEFMRFCENVGCEPTICINAGDGTPAEAAEWVEYCNGDPEETEMGRLRAEHGHPEPYDVTYWEVGNELWGQWQVRWTTATGNADRYQRYSEALLEADPGIKLTACGLETNDDPGMGPLTTNGRWNDTLLERAGDDIRAISDHVLAGGQVSRDTDPRELFRAYMGFSEEFGEVFRGLEDRMREAGIDEPRFDLTELQIFAGLEGDTSEGGPAGDDDAGESEPGGEESESETAEGGAERLTEETLPTPVTISEALYNA